MPVSQLTVNGVDLRAFLISTGLYEPMHMLADETASLITKDNGLPVRSQRSASLTTTIATGATGLSGAIDLDTGTLSALIMPAAWTAAGLSFQISVDGTNFFDFYDKTNAEITMSVAASRAYQLDPSNWLGIRYMKIRSGTTGTPVNQAASRTITLLTS